MAIGFDISATSSKQENLTVGDPCAAYRSMLNTWGRSRAILGGQAQAKAYDEIVNPSVNLLLPFSPFMDLAQYNFYKAEAELPGLVSQYLKVVVGGLLRKNPQFTLPEGVPKEAKEWLEKNFGENGTSMVSFLDAALTEELTSSRAWVVIDYPQFSEAEYAMMTSEERAEVSPYTVLYSAEQVINWRASPRGKNTPSKFTVRLYEESFERNKHHPDLIDTVYDYYLDNDLLVIDKYQRETNDTVKTVAGVSAPQVENNQRAEWKIVDTLMPMMHGQRMTFIPAYPLNGRLEVTSPALQPLVDREIGLYNKVSRRNHLLYGAATYTPYVASDMDDDSFTTIVQSGLGSWIHVAKGETVGCLETPTNALSDMETSIAATIEEMARMGIRMLSPEGSNAESGVSLEIRNAGQTAQLGLLNVKASQVIERIIKVMLKWKYDIDVDASDIEFTLSQDFDPTPIGADWMRLVTEWYEKGFIPRTTFLAIAKQNDIVPSEYDDKAGVAEIQSDPLIDLVPAVDVAAMDNTNTSRKGN